MPKPRRPKQPNIYDNIFGFIFGVQKKGRNKPFPLGKLDGPTATLMEIGTQPTVFPLEMAFKGMNDGIADAVSVGFGDKKKYGYDSGKIALDTKKLMNGGAFGKPKPKDHFMSVAGGVTPWIDGTVFKLYSSFNGAKGKDAWDRGSLVNEILSEDVRRAELGGRKWSEEYSKEKAEKVNTSIFGGSTSLETEFYKRDQQIEDKGIEIEATKLAKALPADERKAFVRGFTGTIKNDRNNKNQAERVQNMQRFLIRYDRFLDNETIRNISISSDNLHRIDADEMKQSVKEKLAEYHVNDKVADEALKKVGKVNTDFQNEVSGRATEERTRIFEELLQTKVHENNNGREEMEHGLENGMSSDELQNISDAKGFGLTKSEIEDIQNEPSLLSQRDALTNRLRTHNVKLSITDVRDFAKETAENAIVRNGKEIAMNAIMEAESRDMLAKRGNNNPTPEEIRNCALAMRYVFEPYSNNRLGYKVKKGILTYGWIKNGGFWQNPFFTGGDWERIGYDDEDLNFTKLVTNINVVNEKGDKVGSYFDGSNSVFGQTIGRFYYWHPANLAKGLFSGDLWLKFCSKKTEKGKAVVNTKSFFYLLSQASPGHILKNSLGEKSKLGKLFGRLFNGVYSITTPFLAGIQKFIAKSVRGLLGFTGVTGILANFLMDGVTERFTKIANQLVLTVLLGLVAILFIIGNAIGTGLTSNDVDALLNTKTTNTESTQENTSFTDTDLGLTE